jgi:hypothetical protein
MPRNYAVHICTIGCDVECRHGHCCVVYWIDQEHPHPTKRGREQHYAMDDVGMMHEWNGAAGKCRIYDTDDDPSGEPAEVITVSLKTGRIL